jgi:hypothetical protein
VAEHYLDEEWKFYSKDGVPLYVTRVRGGVEYRYSQFTAKLYAKDDKIYRLFKEEFETTTPLNRRTTVLMENDHLIAIGEGDGLDRYIHNDVYFNGVGEKFINSWLYRGFNRTLGRAVDLSTTIDDLHRLIQEVDSDGTVLVYQSKLPADMPIFKDILNTGLQKYWVGAGGLLAALLSIPAVLSLKKLLRRLGWSKKKKGSANSLSAGELMALEASERRAEADSTPAGARLSATAELIKFRSVNSPVVIPGGVPTESAEGDLRGEYLRGFLGANGFEEADTEYLVKQMAEGNLTFDDPDIDPTTLQTAPKIISDQSERDFKEGFYSAVEANYGAALVIDSLVRNGFVTVEQFRSQLESEHVKNLPLAMKWKAAQDALIMIAQRRAVAQIANGNYDLLDKLPATPETNVVRWMVAQQIATPAVVSQYAAQTRDMGYDMAQLASSLVDEQVVRPIFDQTLAASYGPLLNDYAKTKMYQAVLDSVRGKLFRNPSLIQPENGDLIIDPYPMDESNEAVTLREDILTRLLMFSPAETQGHSFGQVSNIPAATIHVARRLNSEINIGTSPEEVRKLAKSFATFFVNTTIQQIGKYKKSTARPDTHNAAPNLLVEVQSDMDSEALFSYINLLQIRARRNGEDIPTFESLVPELFGGVVADGADVHSLADHITNGTPLPSANKELIGNPQGWPELDQVGAAMKQATLRLAEEFHPEAAAFDQSNQQGKGVGSFAGQMLKVLSSLKSFWQIRGRNKAVTITLGVVMISVGIYLLPISLGLGMALIGNAFMTLVPLMGRSSDLESKLAFTAVGALSSTYVFGLLVHVLFGKLSLISLEAGLFMTILLLAVALVPTIVSFYHSVYSSLSIIHYHQNVWSSTARSLMGWKSLNPLRIFQGWFWKRQFKAWYQEFQEVEAAHGSITTTGETIRMRLKRLINGEPTLLATLTTAERASWLAALDGDESGTFVKPKSPIAFRTLQQEFIALSRSKPAVNRFTALEATSAFIMNAGERNVFTPENSAMLGTFNANPKNPNQKSSLLGYMARSLTPEWNILIDRMLSMPQFVGNTHIVSLRNFDEWSDFYDFWYQQYQSTSGDAQNTVRERDEMIQMIMGWLGVMLPNDVSVMASLAQNYVAFHLKISSDQADWEYHAAVGDLVTGEGFRSLHELYNALTRPDRSEPLSANERIFVAGYEHYRSRVAALYQPFYGGLATWSFGLANVTLDGQSIHGIAGLDMLRTAVSSLTPVDPADQAAQTVLVGEIELLVRQARSMSYEEWSAAYVEWRRTSPSLNRLIVNGGFVGTKVFGFMEALDQSTYAAVSSGQMDVQNTLYAASDGQVGEKNAAIGSNLWRFRNAHISMDAHVKQDAGQHDFLLNITSLMARNPQVTVVNPAMDVWASETDTFPVMRDYAVAVRNWTGSVQEAHTNPSNRRSNIRFYGKGYANPRTGVYIMTAPGEDTAAEKERKVFQYAYQKEVGIKTSSYNSPWVGYGTFLWGRPSFAASIFGTEMRYAYNTARLSTDRNQHANYQSDAPYDGKLTDIFFSTQYWVSFFALVLIFLHPSVSAFSSFAGIKPFIFFIPVTLGLLTSITFYNVVTWWRNTGSLWLGMWKSLKDTIRTFPFFVPLHSMFVRGGAFASKEIFSFIKSKKETILSSGQTLRESFEENALVKLSSERGSPWGPMAGIAGIVSYVIASLQMTPFGPLVLINYLYSSIVNITGPVSHGERLIKQPYINGRPVYYGLHTVVRLAGPVLRVFGLKVVTKDRLAGRDSWAPIKKLPIMVGYTIQHLVKMDPKTREAKKQARIASKAGQSTEAGPKASGARLANAGVWEPVVKWAAVPLLVFVWAAVKYYMNPVRRNRVAMNKMMLRDASMMQAYQAIKTLIAENGSDSTATIKLVLNAVFDASRSSDDLAANLLNAHEFLGRLKVSAGARWLSDDRSEDEEYGKALGAAAYEILKISLTRVQWSQHLFDITRIKALDADYEVVFEAATRTTRSTVDANWVPYDEVADQNQIITINPAQPSSGAARLATNDSDKAMSELQQPVRFVISSPVGLDEIAAFKTSVDEQARALAFARNVQVDIAVGAPFEALKNTLGRVPGTIIIENQSAEQVRAAVAQEISRINQEDKERLQVIASDLESLGGTALADFALYNLKELTPFAFWASTAVMKQLAQEKRSMEGILSQQAVVRLTSDVPGAVIYLPSAVKRQHEDARRYESMMFQSAADRGNVAIRRIVPYHIGDLTQAEIEELRGEGFELIQIADGLNVMEALRAADSTIRSIADEQFVLVADEADSTLSQSGQVRILQILDQAAFVAKASVELLSGNTDLGLMGIETKDAQAKVYIYRGTVTAKLAALLSAARMSIGATSTAA